MTPTIVAEIGANHLGVYLRAERLIRAAVHFGADAVKLQLYNPDEMVADPKYLIEQGPWAGRTLLELYREAYTPWEWFPRLFNYAKVIGIEIFASVFDAKGVDYLETLACPRYKISSFELVDLGLIGKAASTGKPLIMSTGMASENDISLAVDAAYTAGARDITLLKCTSAYPASAEDANLRGMRKLWREPISAIGISDHTPGCGVACAATILGAHMIEKHLTLSRADGGPDARFSMEPEEFATMVTEVRRAAAAMRGSGDGPSESEKPSQALRRSLYFADNISGGEILEAKHLRTARPALGLSPHCFASLLGRTLATDVKIGTPVTWNVVFASR